MPEGARSTAARWSGLTYNRGVEPLLELIIYTGLAGACIPAGAGLARLQHLHSRKLKEELAHFMVALGAGVLVGAVALVLVPEGIAYLTDPFLATGLVLAGGIAFMAIDIVLARRRSDSPQFVAMAADFLPESLALGGMFAVGADGAALLALLIGLQNLPEGFNAWRELRARGLGGRLAMTQLCGLAVFGPVCGIFGWLWLSEHHSVLAAIMLVAAGGILYLTFQDIAPQARLERRWMPSLGAVVGFALALGGSLLLQ